MRAGATVTTGRWVRLLLLFCTLVGVAAMHTLGHGTHASRPHPGGHAASEHHPASGGAAVALMAMTGDCPADHCRHATALPLSGPDGDPTGWSVCLAVLGAFAVGLLIAVLLGVASRGRPADAGPPGSAAAPRSPPPRPVGLRLAAASVLRR